MARSRRINRAAATATAATLLVLAACGTDGSDSTQREREQQRTSTSDVSTTRMGSTTPAPTLSDALTRAVTSEREARAEYQAVIDALGSIAPFANILAAEEQHIAAIETLAAARNVTLPPDETASPTAPAGKAEACEEGAAGEQDVIALYAELLPIVADDAEATRVFTNLRDVSRDRHLPAFERCA